MNPLFFRASKIRIPMIIPIKGRGFITQGSALQFRVKTLNPRTGRLPPACQNSLEGRQIIFTSPHSQPKIRKNSRGLVLLGVSRK